MTLFARRLQSLLLLLFAAGLIASCSNSSSTSRSLHQTPRPDWIDRVPAGHYLGQSSYALQTVKQAREKAANTALSLMVAAKAGNTADVSGEVQNKTTSAIRGGRESLTNSSTINTTVTISGKEIPVQFRILEYWRDRESGYIYALIEDLDQPGF